MSYGWRAGATKRALSKSVQCQQGLIQKSLGSSVRRSKLINDRQLKEDVKWKEDVKAHSTVMGQI